MESRTEKYTSNDGMPRSRTSRNEQLYKDINKTELQNYEVKSNATVLGDNRKSIDVDKIKSILDTHYNDAAKRRTIAIEKTEETAPNPIFETKEYDINVVLDKAKEQKKDSLEEDQTGKIHDTQFNILKNLDLDEETPLEERAINEKKSKELEDLINTISINEKEIEEAKTKTDSIGISDLEIDTLDDGPKDNQDDVFDDDTEEDLFASLLGDETTEILEGTNNNKLSEDIENLKTIQTPIVEEEPEEDEKEKTKEIDKKEKKEENKKDKEDKDKKEDKEEEEEKPKKKEKDDALDNSFFTKSNAIKKKDFEDFQEIEGEEESSNTFIKIFIVILLIVFVIGIIILIKSFI